MEGIQKIIYADVMPVPDSVFWYTLSVSLLAFSLWVGKRFVDNNKDTFDRHGDLIAKMGNCIIELTTITKVHEVHIQSLIKKVDEQGEDIEALRDFYIVTYKK